MHKRLILLFIILLPLCTKAQIRQEFKYQTLPPLLNELLVARDESQLLVMGEVSFLKDDLPAYEVQYVLTNDPAGATAFFMQVFKESEFLYMEEGRYKYTLDLSSYLGQATYIFITFTHTETKEVYTLFENLNGLDACDFYFKRGRQPHQFSYLRSTDKLEIETLNKDIKTLLVYGYRSAFAQADPPMQISKASPTVAIDTAFFLSVGDDFIPPFEGVFIFKTDSAASKGRSLLVSNPFYPEVRLQDKVREPLVYITTAEEWNELHKEDDIKLQLDKFWLNLLPNQERAKSTIKAFYQNVSLANELFATYKEGWKTDMGMIYIVYGVPSQVLSYNNKEEWIYISEGNNSILSFTFVHTPTLFSASAYSLIREKKYKNSWYPTIDLWRKGRK